MDASTSEINSNVIFNEFKKRKNENILGMCPIASKQCSHELTIILLWSFFMQTILKLGL